MVKNQIAFISPRDGISGLLSEDRESITLISPDAQKDRVIDTIDYANRFPCTAVVEVSESKEVIDYLDAYKENSLALDFTLLLFDQEISQSARKKIAHDLDVMLSNDERREYVLDIILAAPLPKEAAQKEAKAAAGNKERVYSLVDTIIESQSRVQKAYSSWLELQTDLSFSRSRKENIHGILIQFGVFRRLVEEGKTQADKMHLNSIITFDQGLMSQCEPRILTELVASYSGKLPRGPGTNLKLSSTPDTQVDTEHENQFPESVPRTNQEKAEIKLARVESQVDKIAELFGQGRDQQARKILSELEEEQASNKVDHSHVVKSLCNIASKCITRGRPEISLECLTKAFQYNGGVDSVLYVQVGNTFRRVREFEKALLCYKKAREIDDSNRLDSISLEEIRLFVDQGKYEEALEQYQRVPDIEYQPNSLCSLGTLHRKMGNLRQARYYYEKAKELDSTHHVALAGLAEVNKQTGRHYKAILKYNSILSNFSNLSESSTKVYSSASSFLYRISHQYEYAIEILTRLHDKYPMDSDIHLQLAKVYQLDGKTDLANKYYGKVHGPSLNTLAAQLYRTAMEGVNPIVTNRNDHSQSLDFVLPEDKGILACSNALYEIGRGEFDVARRVFDGTRYVDRLCADFSTVLKYHAQKQIDRDYNYKSSQRICRIAKRGHCDLRKIVHSISEHKFDSALNLERQMCLQIL